MVRRLVVGYQLRGIGFNATASNHLASEQVTLQDLHPELLPPRFLVPLAMFEVGVSFTMAGLFVTSHTAEARRKGR